jgi:hypothetical protein
VYSESVAADARGSLPEDQSLPHVLRSAAIMTGRPLRVRPKPRPVGSRREIPVAATLEALDHDGAQPGPLVRGGYWRKGEFPAPRPDCSLRSRAPCVHRFASGFVDSLRPRRQSTHPVIDFMFIDFLNDAFGGSSTRLPKINMSSGHACALLRGCIGIGHSVATHHSQLPFDLQPYPRPPRRGAFDALRAKGLMMYGRCAAKIRCRS